MTDVFSTHTSDSYVRWVLCSGNQISVKMLSLSEKYPQKSSFSFGMADEKWQDDVRLKCSLFWFLGLFLSERTHTPMQKKRRLVQQWDKYNSEIKSKQFRDWGCCRNVNDITTVLINKMKPEVKTEEICRFSREAGTSECFSSLLNKLLKQLIIKSVADSFMANYQLIGWSTNHFGPMVFAGIGRRYVRHGQFSPQYSPYDQKLLLINLIKNY